MGLIKRKWGLLGNVCGGSRLHHRRCCLAVAVALFNACVCAVCGLDSGAANGCIDPQIDRFVCRFQPNYTIELALDRLLGRGKGVHIDSNLITPHHHTSRTYPLPIDATGSAVPTARGKKLKQPLQPCRRHPAGITAPPNTAGATTVAVAIETALLRRRLLCHQGGTRGQGWGET